jgi:autotransporter-associated beta strand protein
MKPKSTLRFLLLAAGSSLLSISSASAQTIAWDAGGGAAATAWYTNTNWNPDTASGSWLTTNVAQFNNDGSATTAGINMNTASLNIGAIQVSSARNRALTIGNSSTTTGSLTLNGATVNSVANTILHNASGQLLTLQNNETGIGKTMNIVLANATDNVIQITGSGGITISSNISGSNGIIRQGAGAGALTLSGNNTYTGLTSVTGGTLILGNINALGSTAVGSNTTISATGGTAAGRLNLNGFSSAENITITGATEASGFNPAIFGSGTLSGTITLDGTNGIRLGSGTTLFSGTITQAVGKTQALVFQGTNTVSNAMTINGGALVIYQGTTTLNGVSGTGIGSTTIDQGGGLRLGITNAINTGADLNFGNSTGTNELNLASFNQTVRGLSSSGTTVTKRVFNSITSTTSTLTVGNGGGNYSFNGTIINNTGTGGTVALVKTGSGNQTLSGTNTYTGGTRIDDGTLTLGHATDTLANTGAVNVNGGILALGTNTDTVGAVTLTSGSITGSGAGTLTGTSYAVESGTISAKLGGAAAMTKTTAGLVTITSDNSSSYTGAVNVNGGTLIIDGNISTSTLTTVNDTATLGGIGTVGALTIQSGGTHAPGNSPGIQAVGNYTMGGTLSMELNGLTAGTQHDRVDVTGTVNLTGTLSLSSIPMSFSAVNDDLIFILLNNGTDAITGTFAGLANGATVGNFGGKNFIISYFANGDSAGSPSFIGGNDIALMAIPEPSTALLGALGLLALLRRRR